MNLTIRCPRLITIPALVATLALGGCGPETGGPSALSDEGALEASVTLHSGPVEILGASGSRVLFRVDTNTATEIRMASRTLKERVVATLPIRETVVASQVRGSDRFLISHNAGNQLVTSWSMLDLAAANPVLEEIAPATQRLQWPPVAGADGTVAYGPYAVSNEYDVYVKAPGSAPVLVGKGWDPLQVSQDGSLVAVRAPNGNVLAYSTKVGKSLEIPATWAGTFAFVGAELFVGNPASQNVIAYSPTLSSKVVYQAVGALKGFRLFGRPDGRLLVEAEDDQSKWNLVLVDPAAGTSTELHAPFGGAPSPEASIATSVLSDDARYLLTWERAAVGGSLGSVWLHALEPSGTKSVKLVDQVNIGLVNLYGGFLIGPGQTLDARCSFEGNFVVCTKTPIPQGQSYRTDDFYIFSASSPANRLPYTPLQRVEEKGETACWAYRDPMVSDGTFGCLSANQTRFESPSFRPRVVSGASFYQGAFLFEEEDRATSHRLLQLFDPKKGITTNVFDSTCDGGPYKTAATDTHLFVADCNGLYSR